MALEKNYKVVAVISTSKHGNDAGEEAGVGKINVPVTKREDAEAVLKETKPQVCLIATKTYVQDVYDDLVILAKLGINAITMGEESMYSWNSSPELTKKLDELFK